MLRGLDLKPKLPKIIYVLLVLKSSMGIWFNDQQKETEGLSRHGG